MKKCFQYKNKDCFQNVSMSEIKLKYIHAYLILITRDFLVVETNYYKETNTEDLGEPKRVGELLRCKNGLEAGCGKHEFCAQCPVRHAITEAFASKCDFENLEASMELCLGDKIIDCDVSVSGAYVDCDEKDQLLLTIHDITKLKNIQRELVVAKEQAERSDRLKSAFLANISHEIHTPLNAIVGFSDLLVMADTDEEKKTYLDIIKQNNERLLKLIRDILDLSKIEANSLEFNYSDVNVNELLHEFKDLFQMRMSATSKVVLTCDTPLEKCIIRTEKIRVFQVLTNLLQNAFKFTSKGNIRFGYRKLSEKELYFYVTDTGIGVPLKEQKNIFNRFTKLNASKQGTGLGLTICKMIIQKLDGKIGVESQVGRGSTFWFTLPLE